mgnify:FL=1
MKNATLFFTLVEIQLALLLISPIMAQDKSPRTLSKVDAELVCICGETFSPYAERVRLIHRLPSNLAPEQLERCRAFLGSPLAGQPLSDLEFNGLKNELVFALLRQREGLTELAELLVRMSRSEETDATWRDYCVQFLGKCYPRINDAKSREAMADALWEALKTQRRGRAAGSAARQLMTLGRTFPEFPPEKVSAASLDALLDPASSDETKTALLQVCGILGERAALPAARTIAELDSSPVLRASAIAAIGMLGDASDLPLLERLAVSGDMRVSIRACSAIDRIMKTAEQPATPPI